MTATEAPLPGSKPTTPRTISTPRRIGTPRNDSQGQAPLDPRVIQLVWTSLKDRIYQRSHNLRQTFRELDAHGTGAIPIPEFVTEMGRAYQLSDVEKRCLALLLTEADFRKDGKIDFREFVEMLKIHHKPHQPGDEPAPPQLSAQERRRFDRCVMDKKMQSLVTRDESRPIKVVGTMPTNELGATTIDSPYGVLGDSERMDAVIAAFLDIKVEKLHTIFRRFDTNNNGRVSHTEFRVGMKELDPYVFDDEIDTLIHILDKKKKGYIVVEEFAAGLGKEYLKKKAHRSQAHESPFQWPSADKPKPHRAVSSGRDAIGSSSSPRKPRQPLPQARGTRATELRNVDTKDKLLEIYRREDGIYQSRVSAGTTSGEYAQRTIPKAPKSLQQMSPRQEQRPHAAAPSSGTSLPPIGSARGSTRGSA